jgi:hypothetical protein
MTGTASGLVNEDSPLTMLVCGTSAGALAALAVLTPDWRIPAAAAVAAVLLMLCFWVLIEPQRWWIGFVVTVLLLPPFPLALGNAGPHIALVFAALGVWCSVAHFGHWRIETDGVTLALASFWCWLLVTTFVAMLYSGVPVALGGMARVGLFGIGVFSYFYIAHGPGRFSNVDVFRWSRWVFCLAAISAAWASIEFYFQWPAFGRFAEQFVWLPFGVFRRAQGVFREAGMLGNVCAMFLVMAAVASARVEVRRRIAPTFWLLMGSSALLCGLVLSFSRSSLVNLAAAGTALLLLERRRIQFGRLLGFIAAALLITGTAAALAAPVVSAMYIRRLSDTFSYAAVSPQVILAGRLEAWSLLLERLADQPSVLPAGVGFKTLPYTSYFGEPLVADNMYLSLLAETGVIGLLLMAVLSIAMMSAASRARRSENIAAWFCGTWFLCFWVGELAQMLFVDVLTYWRVLPLAFFVLALARREVSRTAASAGA